ncbi:MAG: CoA transferase [Proteobacteria bacterium]|nr:CoA transferase [Pseudomonadota bacterium]
MDAPLAGLKVLDLTMNLPGPLCTYYLAQLGAEVVKVENPLTGGDTMRMAFVGTGGEDSPRFVTLNRGKKSITLNLKTDDGQASFRALLNEYDVLVEGFRPGVMASFGLDYASLRDEFPGLIYVSISGYGQDGPRRLQAGHDIGYCAVSGALSMNGDPDTGRITVPAIQAADVSGGSFAALTGLLTAIIARQATGQGTYVDVAMTDGLFPLMFVSAAGALLSGEEARPGGGMLTGRFPCYQIYPSSDGRYVTLGALEPHFWVNFCKALERDDLISRQFDPEAIPEVTEIFNNQDVDFWFDFSRRVDCCLEVVLSLDEALESDYHRHRPNLERIEEKTGRPGLHLHLPFRLGGYEEPKGRPAPKLGEHNE